MLLDDQEKHKVLGRMYSDDQLFRIIVPKRFTLQAYPPGSQIKAGFSETAITTSGDIRPGFTNEDIALVLQYLWPEDFGDLRASDIDAVNNSVKGVGNNLESEADILSYDDETLSSYCHEKLYNKVRREQILNDFKAELHEARKIRAEAVEERFERAEPEVLQYIIVAKLYHAMSWDSIAFCLNRRYARPEGHTSLVSGFNAGLVEEVFRLHAEAKTAIFQGCLRRDWKMLSLIVMTDKIRREAQHQRRFSPVTPAAMTLADNEEENKDSRPW